MNAKATLSLRRHSAEDGEQFSVYKELLVSVSVVRYNCILTRGARLKRKMISDQFLGNITSPNLMRLNNIAPTAAHVFHTTHLDSVGKNLDSTDSETSRGALVSFTGPAASPTVRAFSCVGGAPCLFLSSSW